MAIVTIAADICPIEGNVPYFESGDTENLFHDLLPVFAGSDMVIANLECPIIRRPTPIAKTGPTFGAGEACLRTIRKAGIGTLCLANNHIMDHGAEGLLTTLEVCEREGIRTVGAGRNLAGARRMLIQELGGVRVGVIAVAEHEFSIATATTPGACPLDVIDIVRTIRTNQGKFDFLVVLVHGGDEFCVPSPRIKDTCRFLVESGADAVLVQHPHVLGGYEIYEGAPIVYGQGALVMDEGIYRARRSFHVGYVARLEIKGSRRSTLEIIPFRQSEPVPGARRLTGEDERQFRDSLARRSEAILDDALVEREWLEFCRANARSYLSGVLGHGRVFRKLDVGGILTRLLHPRRALLGTRNCVVCETHREAIQTMFDRGMV